MIDTVEQREAWRQALDEHLQRKARTRALRDELAAARAAGVRLRQQRRAARANPTGGHPDA